MAKFREYGHMPVRDGVEFEYFGDFGSAEDAVTIFQDYLRAMDDHRAHYLRGDGLKNDFYVTMSKAVMV